MITEEELRTLVENDFILGMTVGEAQEEYPDIKVRVVARRLDNGEDMELDRLIDYRGDRVDVRVTDDGVIVELFGVG